MKILSLLLSSSVFCAAAYFFVTEFNSSAELNHLINMSILFILMAICVVGIMMNVPLLIHGKKKVIFYSNYSKKQLVSNGRKLINTNFPAEKNIKIA